MLRPIKLLLGLAGAVALATMVALGPAALAGRANVLEFDTMAPVTGPFVAQSAFNCPNTGTATIRDLTGGALPWVVQRATGDLQTDGSLKIEVTGLVLADQSCVPAALRGVNPVPAFKGLVSCLSIDAAGNEVTVDNATDTFPASPQGNADIEGTVSLPSPCLAPIVFVTGPANQWFATTGI
jgi:hypothetical protein